MMTEENTKLAMETLVAHKFRATLTILGVFIGVVVIVAMAAVLNGFRQSVLDQAESFGTRNVYVWRYPFIMTSRPSVEVLNRKPLTLEDAQAIEQEVAAAEYVYAGIPFAIPMPGEMPPAPPEVRYRDRTMARMQLIGNFPIAEKVMSVPVDNGPLFHGSREPPPRQRLRACFQRRRSALSGRRPHRQDDQRRRAGLQSDRHGKEDEVRPVRLRESGG